MAGLLAGGSLEAPAPAAPFPLHWHFGQVFGEHQPGDEVQQADVLSTVEFDSTGEQLATGDRGGRVVLFEREDGRPKEAHAEAASSSGRFEYRYVTEFQSHEQEFDYLKSQEIEEKINKIRWVQQGANQSRFLLTTNDKTIKLWKVFEKRVRALANFNLPADDRAPRAAAAGAEAAGDAVGGPASPAHSFSSPQLLRIPRVVTSESVLAARCRRVYPNAHTYHIHSLSVNSDCTTFISADDLRVNLWSLDTGGTQSFTIVDMKPDNMEDLTEVITSAVFHPSNCALFAFSSSRGAVRLADMRERALCSSHSRLFEEPEAPGSRSFFSEIIASISDVQFGANGRYLLSRDYLSLKLWDVAMESRPVATFAVHDALRGKLCDVYENDAIFDKFECVMAPNGRYVATGSYGFLMRVFDTHTGADTTVEVSKDPGRAHLLGAAAAPPASPRASDNDGDVLMSDTDLSGALSSSAQPQPPPPGSGLIDPASKLLHLSWHPHRSLVAAATGSSLYLMRAIDPGQRSDAGGGLRANHSSAMDAT